MSVSDNPGVSSIFSVLSLYIGKSGSILDEKDAVVSARRSQNAFILHVYTHGAASVTKWLHIFHD